MQNNFVSKNEEVGLEAFDLQLIAAAHCTGWRALGQLAQRFGDRAVQSAVGKRFVL
jgi:7,8-dihydropterin-6-yl-methyl-4-(beta-D-ribofuranosyl)aminobenzene 5'-phosphate synthase